MYNELIIDDELIKSIFITKSNKINNEQLKKLKLNKLDLKINEYLINRFNDNDNLSYTEIINRILYKIDKRPVCKYCGNPVKWISKNKYRTYCSISCKNKDMYNTIKNITIERYGSSFNRDKFKQTIIDKYGLNNWCNREKFKITFASKTQEELKEIEKRKKQTNLLLYGDENYNNREQCKLTTFLHYGKSSYFCTDECRIKLYKNYLQNKNIIDEKIKNTNLLRYGDKGFNHKKGNKTKLKLYNDEHYNNRVKAEQTMLYNYGVKNIYNLEKYKKLAHSKEANIKRIQSIRNNISLNVLMEYYNKNLFSKRINSIFNTSREEIECLKMLLNIFKTVKCQWTTPEYPFACDFYIDELNLYIECNFFWTHGGHPFDENSIEDQNKLKMWTEKNTKFYNNAIYTWTDLDIRKLNIAKTNNLNIKFFYSIEEFKNWLKNFHMQ